VKQKTEDPKRHRHKEDGSEERSDNGGESYLADVLTEQREGRVYGKKQDMSWGPFEHEAELLRLCPNPPGIYDWSLGLWARGK
jgi:hypothetical protein